MHSMGDRRTWPSIGERRTWPQKRTSGVRAGEGPSSTSFWLRRWMEQSRSPRWITFPCLSANTLAPRQTQSMPQLLPLLELVDPSCSALGKHPVRRPCLISNSFSGYSSFPTPYILAGRISQSQTQGGGNLARASGSLDRALQPLGLVSDVITTSFLKARRNALQHFHCFKSQICQTPPYAKSHRHPAA